ncbi:helix-turn-helix domain-containing protein [Streptomyces sp. OK228]|uniref:helix-turn-helix domain-containing protein n=1 Tax=Streptomyces sp. OK228 TaxID=1882786 RepID=UPI000BC40687|nr:helix-turn-helix domain-containing protein [Streptomyces sp. OK228]SOE25673.1 Helix-turn-helix domain-containing protein [Streptomyces sp. OK228]
MARKKSSAAPPAVINTAARWNLTASLVGFAVILVALTLVAVVGMRVSWVPLRDTADTIGLHEVRQFYPLVIDLLAGLSVVASIALYGSSGYRWAIGTVIGLTAISLTLNVAHGSAAAGVDASSDAPTWGHVILASAAPVICIGFGTHLASLVWGRVATAYQASRGATPPVAASPAATAFRWADAVPPGVRLLPIVAAATAPAVIVTPPVARRSSPMADVVPAGVALLPIARHATPPVAVRGMTMTTAEVARAKGVKTETVRSWVHRGRLTPVAEGADGGSHVFDAADVDAFRS